jgi:hypothetical protein
MLSGDLGSLIIEKTTRLDISPWLGDHGLG